MEEEEVNQLVVRGTATRMAMNGADHWKPIHI